MAASTITPPLLFRALHHLADSGFAPEADSAFTLCRATFWSEPIARCARHLDFRHGRSRVEYNVRVGCRQRMGWLIDRGGVEARVWDEEGGGAPRRELALFDRPPMEGEFFFDELRAHWPVWPEPASYTLAREMLISKVGGAPHGGFAMPPMMPYDFGFGPRIVGPLAAWRTANTGALLVANVAGRADLTDADFVHLAGIKALDMRWCTNSGLTDAAFMCLRGLHTLWIWGCNQASITDAAFAHLHGLHTLYMFGCTQSTITDAAFKHLRGIQVLQMGRCNQATITGAAFAQLRGVRVLRLHGCSPAAIAAARSLGLPVIA